MIENIHVTNQTMSFAIPYGMLDGPVQSLVKSNTDSQQLIWEPSNLPKN